METRYFQFIAGERNGEIVVLNGIEQDDGINFLSFKDGSRCNEEFVVPLNSTDWEGKLMAEISDPSNIWRFTEKWIGREEEKWAENKDGERVCVQPFVEGRRVFEAIPPRKTIAKFGNITKVTETPKPQKNALENDPVWVMMDKAKKFDTFVTLELVVSLPSKSLYNVANESFDNGGNKVIEYIIQHLDDTKLKTSLKTALLQSYNDSETPPPPPPPPSPRLITEGKDPVVTMYVPEEVEAPVIGSPQAKINK